MPAKVTLYLCFIIGCALSLQTKAQEMTLIDKKINFIQQSLDNEATHSFLWQNGWTILRIFTATRAINNWNNAPVGSAKKYDNGIRSITSTLGVIGMFSNPLRTNKSAFLLRNLPAKTDAEKQYKLKMAEKWFAENAAQEQFRHSWTPRIRTFIVVSLSSSAIAFDDNRPKDGLLFFVTGILGSQLKVFSSPSGLQESFEKYQHNDFSKVYKAPSYWQLSTLGTGLSLSYHF